MKLFEVDIKTGAVVDPRDFSPVAASDTEEFDQAVQIALNKPQHFDKAKENLLLILQIIQTIGIGLILLLLYNLLKISAGHGGTIGVV